MRVRTPYHLQQREEQRVDRGGLPPDTGGELGQRLQAPLQEEEVGLAPLPDPPDGPQDGAAQRRVL